MSQESFENLVNEHGRQVLNTALRVLGDVNLAHDVHQEVFLAIWKRWPRYNGQTNWPAYLYRATVRKALETAKKAAREPAAEHAAEQPSSFQQPEQAALTQELHRKLSEGLDKLSSQQADAFVLSRIEGLSCTDIAEILTCSEATVRVHLSRATQKMVQELNRYMKQFRGTA